MMPSLTIFPGLGAKVVFGDVNDAAGHQLESELNSAGAKYIHCDTSKYADQLAMFAMAHENFGRVDIVVANAGMCIPEDAFAAGQDISKEPSMKELDVNLKGELFTARIGLHYLRQSGGGDLILVSSVAGFKEAAGLTPYLASKHGIIGVLRGLRMSVINENIRVNVICPWMTSRLQ
jgi:NAD(P)-dependent dehydrogenase (short-subunit alcohol dehydrogenase family)